MPRCLFALFLLGTTPPPVQYVWPRGFDLPAGWPIDEANRHQFARCDASGVFRDHIDHFTRRCPSDPKVVTALGRLPSGATTYASKLAVDLDGSPFACDPQHGHTDQCPTSLMLPDGHGGEVPVDADVVPYVVIPDDGPSETAGPSDVVGEFLRRTGLRVGDFDIVIYHRRATLVIVADTGPFPKLGEGSLALHGTLGRDQWNSLRYRTATSACGNPAT